MHFISNSGAESAGKQICLQQHIRRREKWPNFLMFQTLWFMQYTWQSATHIDSKIFNRTSRTRHAQIFWSELVFHEYNLAKFHRHLGLPALQVAERSKATLLHCRYNAWKSHFKWNSSDEIKPWNSGVILKFNFEIKLILFFVNLWLKFCLPMIEIVVKYFWSIFDWKFLSIYEI